MVVRVQDLLLVAVDVDWDWRWVAGCSLLAGVT